MSIIPSDYLEQVAAGIKRRISWGRRAAKRLKKFVGKDDNIYISDALSEMFNQIEHKNEIVSNHINWTFDRYVGKRFWALVPEMHKIYTWLKVHNYTIKKPDSFDYNDLDNGAFIVPSDDAKEIFIITSQNRDYLYILGDQDWFAELHIRRLYREIPDLKKMKRDFEYKYEKEEQDKYKKGIYYGAVHSEALMEYTDDYLDNIYINRPSLRTFQRWNFKMNLKDSRDPGYVVSVVRSPHSVIRSDSPLGTIYEINRAAFEIQSLSCVIDEEK
jgi:hypothetical protein